MSCSCPGPADACCPVRLLRSNLWHQQEGIPYVTVGWFLYSPYLAHTCTTRTMPPAEQESELEAAQEEVAALEAHLLAAGTSGDLEQKSAVFDALCAMDQEAMDQEAGEGEEEAGGGVESEAAEGLAGAQDAEVGLAMAREAACGMLQPAGTSCSRCTSATGSPCKQPSPSPAQPTVGAGQGACPAPAGVPAIEDASRPQERGGLRGGL